MFGTKKNKQIEKKLGDKKGKNSVFVQGARSIKDMLAPASIDRSSEYELRVEEKYNRNFVLSGYPSNLYIGWMDELYNYEGDMDVAIHIEPADERSALNELTDKITQYESQLAIETEKGSIKNLTQLQTKISQLYQQRAMLEQNHENQFKIETFASLYADDLKTLNKEAQKLDNRLSGRKIKLMPLYMRQDEAYRSVLPYARPRIYDYYRNINTGALTSCFPFYNAEISHDNGTFIGVNMATATPIYIDFYNKDILDNANMFVFGKAGSGKTFCVSLLTMRSVINGVKSVIIDPEGEYKKVTDASGGAYIELAPDRFMMNPFDIEAEDETDDDGVPTGKKVVNIKDKAATLLNLIAVMSKGTLTADCESSVAHVLAELYKKRGINETEESLYEDGESYLDRTTMQYVFGKKVKKMPQMSDFRNDLIEYTNNISNVALKNKLLMIAETIKMYCKGGIYDMFDCQTSTDVDFNSAPVITFDVSNIEEDVLRPIAMYIAMSWTWEKFVKKHPEQKKRVVCDEAWMLVSKSMAGSEYTGKFLENCARRIRKRNGGLLVASQNFKEFADSPQGQAVLTNTTVKMFMKQDPVDINDVHDTFLLSEGEKQFLLSLRRGEMLLKMNQESSQAYVYAFDFEADLIKRKYLDNPKKTM